MNSPSRKGAKLSGRLRRWLDPRAAFEGAWLQETTGGTDSALSIFSTDHDAESDSCALRGNSYPHDGRLWARWKSTNVSIDERQLRTTYPIQFRLRRVTTPVIAELGLPFTLHDLRLDTHDETRGWRQPTCACVWP